MPRRIAILGASGSVGSALAVHILRARLLEPSDQLLLVGHGVHTTEQKLLSTRIDLMDAFDDDRVRIEVVPDVADVEADIVIVSAGATLGPASPTRRDLGATNRAIFEHIAEQCVGRLSQALFIVVSNPVELAVEILSFAVDRKRVFGMGAQQDSMRFARAIASDLGVSRHDVRATVMGEHGQAMVPLWGSVELMPGDPRAADYFRDLRERVAECPLETRVGTLRSLVSELLSQERIAEAYALTHGALPDAQDLRRALHHCTLYAFDAQRNGERHASMCCGRFGERSSANSWTGGLKRRGAGSERSVRFASYRRNEWLARRGAGLAGAGRD